MTDDAVTASAVRTLQRQVADAEQREADVTMPAIRRARLQLLQLIDDHAKARPADLDGRRRLRAVLDTLDVF